MDILYNPFSIARKVKRPLILDGAMGSLLQLHNVPRDEYMWMSMANITHPQEVIKLHREYIDAGADIITTNTFRTNPEAVRGYLLNTGKHAVEIKAAVRKSVNLAKEAVNGASMLIAGSNAPAEDCYQKEVTLTTDELCRNHEVHIKELFRYGCDFILNETMSHYAEIEAVSSICAKEGIPFVVSIFFDDEFKLLSGESIDEGVDCILKYKPQAVGFNCIRPELFLNFLCKWRLNFNWGIYMNCGSGSYNDDIITPGITPSDYKNIIKEMLKYDPSFIGGCCGTTPAHIKNLREIFDERISN
jgi:homocysteine S-methyltransferase